MVGEETWRNIYERRMGRTARRLAMFEKTEGTTCVGRTKSVSALIVKGGTGIVTPGACWWRADNLPATLSASEKQGDLATMVFLQQNARWSAPGKNTRNSGTANSRLVEQSFKRPIIGMLIPPS